jgi:hypothetical protein
MAVKHFHPDRLPDFPIIDGQGHRLNDYGIGYKLPPGCAAMIRNPIERFKSLINKLRVTPEQAFCWLYWYYDIGSMPEHTDRKDLEYIHGTTIYHFAPASSLIELDSELFIWPDIKKMTQYLGINQEICHINQSDSKIDLSNKQIDKINEFYSKDIELYNKLKFK